MIHIPVGDVDLFAARLDQRCVALMGHHTDDLSPLSFRRANAKQDSLAHGRLIWKCLRRECLIDYQKSPVRCELSSCVKVLPAKSFVPIDSK